jgi:hypothetical protein
LLFYDVPATPVGDAEPSERALRVDESGGDLHISDYLPSIIKEQLSTKITTPEM